MAAWIKILICTNVILFIFSDIYVYPKQLTKYILTFQDSLKGLKKLGSHLGKALKGLTGSLKKVTKSVGKALKGAVKAVGKGVKHVFKKSFKLVSKGVKHVFKGVGKGVKSVGKAIGRGAKKVWSGIKSKLLLSLGFQIRGCYPKLIFEFLII